MKTKQNVTSNRPWSGAGRGGLSRSRTAALRGVVAGQRRRLELKKILVPVDFSNESSKALRYALPFARCYGARITLLYVIQANGCAVDYGYGPVTRTCGDPARIRRVTARLRAYGKKHVGRRYLGGVMVRQGAAFDEITRAARQLNSDCIIMSRRDDRNLAPGCPNSTSERVVRHAPCPVLVVRQREHPFG